MQKLTIYELIITDGDYIRVYRTTDPIQITLFSQFLGVLGHSEDVGYCWEPLALSCVRIQLKYPHA